MLSIGAPWPMANSMHKWPRNRIDKWMRSRPQMWNLLGREVRNVGLNIFYKQQANKNRLW